MDQLKTIATILGTDKMGKVKSEKMKEALKSLNLEGLPENWSLIDKHINEIEFDFLKEMVALDPERRLSCKELQQHPYFSDK